jgi:hypothetical protein
MSETGGGKSSPDDTGKGAGAVGGGPPSILVVGYGEYVAIGNTLTDKFLWPHERGIGVLANVLQPTTKGSSPTKDTPHKINPFTGNRDLGPFDATQRTSLLVPQTPAASAGMVQTNRTELTVGQIGTLISGIRPIDVVEVEGTRYARFKISISGVPTYLYYNDALQRWWTKTAPPPQKTNESSSPPHSSAPLPPVDGPNSRLLVPHGFIWQQYELALNDAFNPDNPTWARIVLGTLSVIAAPAAGLEEYVGRSLLNIPYVIDNAGTGAGEHLARGYLLREMAENGENSDPTAAAEGVAEYAEGVANLAAGFVTLASLFGTARSSSSTSESVQVATNPRPSWRQRIEVDLSRLYNDERNSIQAPGTGLPDANYQHVLRGGPTQRGVGVLHLDVTQLTPNEIEASINNIRDADLQAGMAGGLTRTAVPPNAAASAIERATNAASNSAKRLGRTTLNLGKGEIASHLPDVAGGGNPMGPLTGEATRPNSAIGGQWSRYAPGFVFEGYSLINRYTGEFLYVSHALEHEPAPILDFAE